MMMGRVCLTFMMRTTNILDSDSLQTMDNLFSFQDYKEKKLKEDSQTMKFLKKSEFLEELTNKASTSVAGLITRWSLINLT